MSDGIHEKGLGTQGLEIELQDPSHLFRHASEITKGNKKLMAVCYAILVSFQKFTILALLKIELFYRDQRRILARKNISSEGEAARWRWSKQQKMQQLFSASKLGARQY